MVRVIKTDAIGFGDYAGSLYDTEVDGIAYDEHLLTIEQVASKPSAIIQVRPLPPSNTPPPVAFNAQGKCSPPKGWFK